VPAVVVTAVAFAVADLSLPGSDEQPGFSVGATAAAAAVGELSDSLERGVLARVAVQTSRFGSVGVTTETDWTNLANRDRHTRVQSGDLDLEYWNPSVHERWTIDHRWRAADGRTVVNYTDGDAKNNSSAASPVEEVGELLDLARRGELTLRREGDEVVVERTDRCFASPDLGAMECADPDGGADRRWPDAPPAGMKAVTSFQTWWLSATGQPRLLREENGAIEAGSSRREVVFRSDYRRWEVLPATPENLRRVDPPSFPAGRYLVLEGENAVGDAIRDGRVRCGGREAC